MGKLQRINLDFKCKFKKNLRLGNKFSYLVSKYNKRELGQNRIISIEGCLNYLKTVRV